MRAKNNVSRHFSVTREGINVRMIPRAIHRSLAPCFAALASLLFPATPGKQADAAE